MFLLWVLKSSLIVLAASGVGLILRRRSAALRHLMWVAAFVVVAGLPLLQVALQPVSSSVRVEVPPPPLRLVSHSNPKEIRLVGAEPVPSQAETVTTEGYGLFVPNYEGLLAIAYVLGLVALLRPFAEGLRRVRQAILHGRTLEVEAPFVGFDVRVCAAAHSLRVPATFGWLRPVILLPSDAEGWDRTRLNAVLAHEVAHIRRADWFWQTFSQAVAAVQWFNPLAWWAVRQLRLESELAADDQVLSLGLEPSAYAQELLAFGRAKPDGFCAVPMARRSGLGRRIAAVLSARQDRSVPGAMVRGRLVVIGTLCALGVGALAIRETQAARPAVQGGNPAKDALYTGRFISFWPDTNLTLTQVVSVNPDGSHRQWGVDGRQPARPRPAFLLSKLPTAVRLYEIQAEGAKFNLLPGDGYRIKATDYRRSGKLNVYLIEVNSAATPVILHVQTASPIGGSYEILDRDAFHLQQKGNRWVGYMENKKPGIYELEGVDGRVKRVRAKTGRTPLNLPVPVREGRREFRQLTDAMLGPILLQPAVPVKTDPHGVWLRQTIAGLPLAIGWIEDTTTSRPFRVWGPDGGVPNLIKSSDFGHVSSYSPDHYEERRVILVCEVVGKPRNTTDIDYVWKLPKDVSTRGSSTSGMSGRKTQKVGEVLVEVDRNTEQLDLQLGVATGVWKEVCSERLGGPTLKSSSYISYQLVNNGSPSLVLKFTLPSTVRDQDYRIEAFDAKGIPFKSDSRSENGNTIEVTLTPRKNAKVSRVRLLARPYEWGTFRNIAMQPKGGF